VVVVVAMRAPLLRVFHRSRTLSLIVITQKSPPPLHSPLLVSAGEGGFFYVRMIVLDWV
jgi:hypothetical protein